MKRSGAIWLVVGVVAVAAVLMYFFVLPQIRDGKTVQDIAKKAGETVEDVKQSVNDAAKQVEKVADGAEEIKAAALVKMQRIGQDTATAAEEMKALFDKGTPTAEQIAAAKAKLAAALKSASDLKLPESADSTATAAAAKIADGAKSALAALDKLPADPAAAKAALADIEAKLTAALPEEAAVKPADTTEPAKTTADDGGAKTAAQQADKAKEAAKPVEAAKAAVPAFDILRVEKDGSTVIAGRADPGAKIEIVDGDKVIATAQADAAGDFAAVLDNPLAAGDHSIVIKATAKDGKPSTSEQVATVSVPKDASGELLAMVTKPGEASKIINMPGAKDSVVASSKNVTSDAAAQQNADGSATTVKSDDAAKATTKVAKADATKTNEPAKVDEGAKPADAATDVAASTPDLPANASDIASTPPIVIQDQTAGDAEQQTAKADEAATKPAFDKPADIAKADQSQSTGAPDVMVSAVELEGDKIFIAGNTKPGVTVRLYADDQIVAEAKADETGRFVAEGAIKLSVGDHTIRADVLSADGAKVEVRASVPFFRPEGDLAAVASADPAKNASNIEPIANGAFDKARDEAGKAVELLKGLYAGGKTPTAEELAAARSSAEIALKSLADTHVGDDVDPAVAKMAAKAADDAGKALDKLKAVPADVAAFKSALPDVETMVETAVAPGTEVASADEVNKIAAKSAVKDMAAAQAKKSAEAMTPADTAQTVEKQGEQVSSNDVKVTAKVERLKAAEPAQDQPSSNIQGSEDAAAKPADSAAANDEAKVARQDDQSASQQTASADQPKVIEQAPLTQSEGSVIIRRGDTLWQISRRVYGRGVRYTTIYMANQKQIEDPDRIRPGQIFSMPGKWLDNAEELHKERLAHEHKL